jgi:AcrR family transcriptional regulator
MSSEKTNKKNVILDTAKTVFAEKGFDGARMDEIAERAGVKKSLIYYHFEGKDHLLQEILNGFFEEYAKLLRSDNEDEDFLDRNSDLLRVILIESLKKNTKLPTVFKAVEMLIQFEQESGKKSLAQRSSDDKRMVVEFFTSILPSVCYTCYKEAWSNYFNVDSVTLDKYFTEALDETHNQYHKNMNRSEWKNE